MNNLDSNDSWGGWGGSPEDDRKMLEQASAEVAKLGDLKPVSRNSFIAVRQLMTTLFTTKSVPATEPKPAA